MISLLVLVLAAPKAPTQAPVKPTLPAKAAVFVAGDDEAKAVKVEAELLRALEAAEVPLVDVLAAYPAPEPDGAGAQLVKEARQAYEDLDYEAAAKKWADALAFFNQNPATATSAVLGEAHFYIGALAVMNGGKSQLKKAAEEFQRALLHAPDLQCDAQTWGADTKKTFDKAAQDLAARGTGALTAESTPAGAEVHLRGRAVGHTPLAEPVTVPVGRHLLLFSRPGFAQAGVLADVSKDGFQAQATLTAARGYDDLRAAVAAATNEGLGKSGKPPAGARKVADLVKARFLVVGDGTKAEAWDLETGNRLTNLPLSSDDLAATSRKIHDFVTKPAPITADAVATGEPGDGIPLFKQWWFWTAVGVVAVGTATSVGVVAANNSRGRPYNVLLGLP